MVKAKASHAKAALSAVVDATTAKAAAAAATAASSRRSSRRISAAEPAGPTAPASAAASHDENAVTADAAGAVDAAPTSPGPALTAYELERLQRIERNRQRLAELQVLEAAQQLVPPPREPKVAKPKGLSSSKRKAQEEPPPRRASLRQRGVASDGMHLVEEMPGGKLVLSSTGNVGGGPSSQLAAVEAAGPRQRHSTGPLPFSSGEGRDEQDTDAAFLSTLLALSSHGGGRSAADGKREVDAGVAALSRLQLREEDVAKVVQGPITHIAFYPSATNLLVAAADKNGHVGLWQLRGRLGGSAAAAGALGGDDVIAQYSPHSQFVCGLVWAGEGCAGLTSASYDGSVRRLDVEAGVWQLLLSSEDAELSALAPARDGGLVYAGDVDGGLYMIDTRTAAPASGSEPLQLTRGKKINCLSLDPASEAVLALAASDGSVSCWDTRALGRGAKPLGIGRHKQTCQSAYFAHDGSHRIVSTSRDNTLKVWDASGGAPVLAASHFHDNYTGRWISPLRAAWGTRCQTIAVGNARQGIDIMDAVAGPNAMITLHSEYLTAKTPRCAMHATLPLLCGGTSSGRLHVFY